VSPFRYWIGQTLYACWLAVTGARAAFVILLGGTP
jgi:hypothetical protein